MTAITPADTHRRLLGIVLAVFSILALVIPAHAQLAGSGTAGDRAVYTVNPLEPLADGLGTNTTHVWSTTATVADLNDSFDIDTTASRILLTGGHHLVLYGFEYAVGINQRAGFDSVLKLNGTEIPYGASSGFLRNTVNPVGLSRGGTILEVAQGDYIEVESERTDDQAHLGLAQNRADIQLLKLDDANLDFLRLSVGSDSTLMAANTVGPATVVYDTQDEIDNPGTSFDHDTTQPGITLKEAGKYLVFANTGMTNTGTGNRNMITQNLLVNGSTVNGGSTTVYIRSTQALESGVATIGTIIETSAADSVLTVSLTRDNTTATNSVVGLVAARTGITILKLPAYARTIGLAGGTQDVNTSGARDFTGTPATANASFSYDSVNISASEIQINMDGDYLFLSSYLGMTPDSDGQTDRSIAEIGFQLIGSQGGTVNYGSGASYSRDDTAGADRSRFAGAWAGAIIPNLLETDGAETFTSPRGQSNVSSGALTSSLAFQGIDIASISEIPIDPQLVVNTGLNVLISSTGTVIGTSNLQTVDTNTTSTATIEYEITDDSFLDGTLRLSGTPLAFGDTFTQADIDAGILTYDAPAFEVFDPGAEFSFDVVDTDDLGEIPASGIFVINVGDPGVIVPDSFSITGNSAANEDNLDDIASVGVGVIGNDTGTGVAVLSMDTASANGIPIVLIDPLSGSFEYNEPPVSGALIALAQGEVLVDTFEYTGIDFLGNSDTTTVTATITGENDNPTVVSESIVLTDLSLGTSLNVLTNDSDVDNGAILDVGTICTSSGTGLDGLYDSSAAAPLTFTSTNGAIVSFGADGSFSYDISQTSAFYDLTAFALPLSEQFKYVVEDEFGGTSAGTITVTVGPTVGASNNIATVNATAGVLVPADDPPKNFNVLANDSRVSGSGSIATTTDIVIEFNADTTTNTDTDWFNTGQTSATTATPSRAVVGGTLLTSLVNPPPGLTKAYSFSGGAAAIGDSGMSIVDIGDDTAWAGGGEDLDVSNATIEMAFRPSDQVGDEVLFETGGFTDGAGIYLVDNQIVANFADNVGNVLQLVGPLPAGATAGGEFVHILATIDLGTDVGNLYVNGALVATQTGQINLNDGTSGVDITDWGGTNDGGIGLPIPDRGGDGSLGAFGTVNTNNTIDFSGEIALVRFYDKVLDASERQANFSAIFGSVGGVVPADVTDIGGNASPAPGTSGLVLPSGATLDYEVDGSFSYTPGSALVMLDGGAMVAASDVGLGLTATDIFTYSVNSSVNGTAQVVMTINGTNPDSQIQVTANSATTTEGAGAGDLAFTVTASGGGPSAPVTVTFGISGDVDATPGTDFTGTLTVPIGTSVTSVPFSLTSVNDTLFEGDESLTLSIIGVTGPGVVGANSSDTITITDAQSEPGFVASADAGSFGEGGTADFTFTPTTPSDVDITLDFSFSGTSVEGFDYFSEGGQLVIPAGASSGSANLFLIDDGLAEGTESLTISVDSVSLGTVSTTTATTSVTDGSAANAFYASFDTSAVDLLVAGNMSTTINAPAAANAGTELGSWENVITVSAGGEVPGVITEAVDVKGELGLEPGAVPAPGSIDQFLRIDRPGTAAQTNGLFVEVGAVFADTIDFSGSNTGVIAFDLLQDRTDGQDDKNWEIWGLDPDGNIVIRLIVSANTTGGQGTDERMLVATDLDPVAFEPPANTGNFIGIGNGNDVQNAASWSESQLTRFTLILNSTNFDIGVDDEPINGGNLAFDTALPYVGGSRQISKLVFAVKADDNTGLSAGIAIDDILASGFDGNSKPSITENGVELADGGSSSLPFLLTGQTVVFNAANNNELQISDADDLGASDLSVRVQSGIAGSTTMVTAAGSAIVSGNNSTNVLITGTEADINATLANGVTVTAGASGGAETIVVTVDDAGNTGIGGALTTDHTYAFTVFENPIVAINQKDTQADPTAGSSVVFTAVFSEDVDGFDTGATDVTLSGTAGGTLSAVIAEVAPNDGTTYEVTVSGFTSTGTVIADIPAGAAFRAGVPADTNYPSTSDDNEVLAAVNTAPTATNLPQSITYDGTTVLPVELDDIVVSDAENFIDSRIDIDTTVFLYNYPADDTTTKFDLDNTAGGDPNNSLGFSLEVVFTVEPEDVAIGGGGGQTGENRRVIAELGGNGNGNGVYVIDGLPYFVAKMNSAAGQTTTLTPPGSDLDWDNTGAGDEMVVVQLSSDPLTPGDENSVALIFDLDTLEYSVNGDVASTVSFLNRDGNNNWAGDNTVSLGLDGGEGGLTSTTTSTFHNTPFGDLASTTAIITAKLWNVSDDSVDISTRLLEEEITATLSIQSYVDATSGTLTAASGKGESFSAVTGVWTITADRDDVTEALIDVAFNVGSATADPTLIDVSISDGGENGAAPVLGTITLNQADLGVDPDGDFIETLLEEAFDTDPGDPNSGREGLPTIRVVGTDAVIRYRVLDSPGSITYAVQTAADATTWVTDPGTPVAATVQTGGPLPEATASTTVFELTIPLSGGPIDHWRLLIQD